MTTEILVNIGSGNGSLPDGNFTGNDQDIYPWCEFGKLHLPGANKLTYHYTHIMDGLSFQEFHGFQCQ